jgi:hypothetical protein
MFFDILYKPYTTIQYTCALQRFWAVLALAVGFNVFCLSLCYRKIDLAASGVVFWCFVYRGCRCYNRIKKTSIGFHIRKLRNKSFVCLFDAWEKLFKTFMFWIVYLKVLCFYRWFHCVVFATPWAHHGPWGPKLGPPTGP